MTSTEKIRRLISEAIKAAYLLEIAQKEKDRLVSILNSLEFKNDVLSGGGQIYAVGGIVRDALIGKQSDDLDLVIQGIPYNKLFQILLKYGKATDTSIEKDEGRDFGATKFVSNNSEFNQLLSDNGIRREIDIMLPRKDSKEIGAKGHRAIKSSVDPNFTIEDDLKRRDITINAIALTLDGNIIDVGTGVDDLKRGVVRAVSADAFIEDPLRILRAIRMAARFNYKIDNQTLELIRSNANLLSDKNELPRERFLMEFEKMIGKADLGRAVRLLVELGLYKSMFGIDSRVKDFNEFDKARNIAEFCFLLFKNEPDKKIIQLSFDNITNSNDDISYLEALLKYRSEIIGSELSFIDRINKLADIFKKSSDFLLNSSFVLSEDKKIANDFASGTIPKGDHDIALKGDEFKGFITDLIKNKSGSFNPREDGRKMGKAKFLALQAIYGGEINNNPESIRNYISKNIERWIG